MLSRFNTEIRVRVHSLAYVFTRISHFCSVAVYFLRQCYFLLHETLI